MPFASLSDVQEALRRLDEASFWPEGARATLILVDGVALFFYGVWGGIPEDGGRGRTPDRVPRASRSAGGGHVSASGV